MEIFCPIDFLSVPPPNKFHDPYLHGILNKKNLFTFLNSCMLEISVHIISLIGSSHNIAHWYCMLCDVRRSIEAMTQVLV